MSSTPRTSRPHGHRAPAATVLAALLVAAAAGCAGPSGGTGAGDGGTGAAAGPAVSTEPAPATSPATSPATAPATSPAASTVPSTGTPGPGASTSTSATGSPATATPGGGAPAAPPVVQIDDFAYDVPTSVPPGATVEVRNVDVETHTLTSGDGAFAVTVPVDGTGTFVAPAEPGTYRFVCLLHGGMEDVLTVG